MGRIQLEALGLEFDEGGSTIWIHGPGGTLLRVKCSGRITAKSCTAPVPHADVIVPGDIEFCVPVEEPAETHLERLCAALREACDLIDEANGNPSECSYVVPIGERAAELRKIADSAPPCCATEKIL